jgi:hypothetical protein|tara:strand:+ start:8865 stop:9233 length:369 start_codon:yes stop_codon:yes gene_type:complete
MGVITPPCTLQSLFSASPNKVCRRKPVDLLSLGRTAEPFPPSRTKPRRDAFPGPIIFFSRSFRTVSSPTMVSGIFAALFSFAPRTTRSSFHEFHSELDVHQKPHDFAQHKGKVVVVSNVASY